MSCFTCGRQSLWKDLSRAAAKLAGAQFRALGALPRHRQWPVRASVCELCPIRVLRGGITYCGQPFLSKPSRTPADGCGCPVNSKAKDPHEHCPLDARHRPAIEEEGACNCKWCSVDSALVRAGQTAN